MTIEETDDGCSPSVSNAWLAARRFPVMKPPPGCTAWVRWDALDPQWAMRIHGQTLERLAERGGLCAEEIMLNLKRLKWSAITPKDEAIALTNSIAANKQLTDFWITPQFEC